MVRQGFRDCRDRLRNAVDKLCTSFGWAVDERAVVERAVVVVEEEEEEEDKKDKEDIKIVLCIL